jgi:hypothetical protein
MAIVAEMMVSNAAVGGDRAGKSARTSFDGTVKDGRAAAASFPA